MTIGERVKVVRNALSITQKALGDALGLKNNTIATYESGRQDPSDRTITDICRVYGVNEVWLRTGEGEMFRTPARKEALTVFFADVLREDGDSFKQQFLSVLAQLNEDQWVLLADMAEKLAREADAEKDD